MAGLLIGLTAILVGAAEVWLCWRGSQRRLTPGGPIGLPLASVRRSDATWYAAHEAAAGPFGVAGGIACTCGIGIVVNGFDVIGAGLAVVAAVSVVVGALWAGVVGQRAANALAT